MKMPLMAALVVMLCTALSRPAHASFINYSSREINVKIVYYAPAATTAATGNLQYIYGKTNPEAKGKLIKLTTQSDSTGDLSDSSTVFFDFLPLSLGEIRGFKTHFHLYTVPVADPYISSRVLLLKGVDGIVFIADAAPTQAKANLARLQELKTNLKDLGYDFDKTPIVFQIVGTSAVGAIPVADLKIALGIGAQQVFEADPTTGIGVFDTLKAIAKLILMELKEGADATTESPPASPTSKRKVTSKRNSKITRKPPLPPGSAAKQPAAPK